MPTPSTGTLALPTTDPASADGTLAAPAPADGPPAGSPPPAPVEPLPALDREAALVRPADLVTALTGVTLGFFALFVHGIAQWKYVGPGVEEASVLGWLAPALVGLVCVVTAAVSVAVRAVRADARRRALAPSGAAS
ncbi:hypothetical protein [Rathayibacter sp. VKM Ac-2760]|uniref:hypothetical protein n=1 Tax=Rathayibacter sp. VKM Ac-2760 TaxID=2609253 RepID=UPI0013188B74|nr:hypothetical protein [Rathayibacter sp. VKM Ac-2760]QHC59566.1 hypothetical protein GSU72_14135 [Rathayibacter sp. VKM Ac-2760]